MKGEIKSSFMDALDNRVDSEDDEEINILANVEATDVNVAAEKSVWGHRAAKNQLHDSLTLVRKDHLAKFGPPPPPEAIVDGFLSENHVVLFSNLPESLNEIDLKQLVQEAGSVRHVRIVENPSTGVSTGNAVVVFTSAAAAQQFISGQKGLMRRVANSSSSFKHSLSGQSSDFMCKVDVRAVSKDEAEALGILNSNRTALVLSWISGGAVPPWAPDSLLDTLHAIPVGEDQWTKVDVLAVIDALLDEETITDIRHSYDKKSSASHAFTVAEEGEIPNFSGGRFNHNVGEERPIKRARTMSNTPSSDGFDHTSLAAFEKLQAQWIATQRFHSPANPVAHATFSNNINSVNTSSYANPSSGPSTSGVLPSNPNSSVSLTNNNPMMTNNNSPYGINFGNNASIPPPHSYHEANFNNIIKYEPVSSYNEFNTASSDADINNTYFVPRNTTANLQNNVVGNTDMTFAPITTNASFKDGTAGDTASFAPRSLHYSNRMY